MIATSPLEQIQYRLARYYLDKLRVAEAAYEHGHEHSDYALAVFDCEWQHIKQWQQWAASHANDDVLIAVLCKEYSQSADKLLTFRQHPQERLEWLEAGLAAARQLGDTHAEMVHLYQLGKVQHTLGSLVIAQDCAENSLALAQQLDNPFYISKILIALGNIFYSKTEFTQAQAALEQALFLSEALDARQEIGLALNTLGSVAFTQGDYARAHDCLVQALAIYEVHGLPHHVCVVLDDLSNLALQTGDEDAAAIYAERCVVLSRAIGNQYHLASSLGTLGNLAKARENFTEASAYFQQSLDISRLLGRPSQEVLAWIRLGTLFLQMHDPAAALECFESALSLPNASGFRAYRAITLMAMAQAFRMMGQLSHASMKLRQGLEIALSIKSIMIQTWYLLEAVWLWYERGQFEQAATWIMLLQENINELDREQQLTLDELIQKLKTKLGQAQYMRTIEQSKILDLSSVLETILKELL